MNFLSLAHFSAFLIYVWLSVFILSKNPKAKLNQVTAMLFACFAVWNLTTAFYYAAATKPGALFWLNLTSFCWCSLASLFLWFTFVFTNMEKVSNHWYFHFLNFLFPALFIYQQFKGNLAYDVTKEFYGWASIWSGSIWPQLLYAHYFLFFSIGLYFNFDLIKKTKLIHEKKRAKLVIISGSISLILSTVTDIILVYFKATVIPPLGSIFILLWAGGIVFAITKYKLMVLTPAYAATDILATMSDSLILVDPAGQILEVNQATLELLGFSKPEVIGQPVTFLFSESTPGFKKFDLGKLFQENAPKELLISLRTKNGKGIPVSFSGALMRDQEDNVIGVIVIARDLRELLRLQEKEQEFIVAKARSEALEERAQELQAAYHKLQTTQTILLQAEKMAAVGQLAGGVAHEINNPIGIILGFAQSIVRKLKDDDLLYLPLKSIEREAVRCKKLVGYLLTFSRSGKTQAETIDINIIIDETISLIATRAKVKNIEIIKEYSPGLPQIMANKNQLQQVIMNLCNNAIDAIEAVNKTEAGDQTVAANSLGAVDSRPGVDKITIFTGVIVNQIQIRISDTGLGMTDEVKKHLFEPFFTTKEIGKGTGLGLSLCYEIIQKHQGVIEVESEAGKGATFVVKLPIGEPKK